jgi:predicted aspartyl protease
MSSGALARWPTVDSVNLDSGLELAESGDLAALEAAEPTMRDPGLRALADARLDAGRFDEAKADQDLRRYFATRDVDPWRQAVAWSIAADIALVRGDYRGAAEASAQWAGRLPEENPKRRDATQNETIARLLADVPPQSIIDGKPVTISTSRDKLGLMTADAVIDGHAQEAILDTGANLSVLSLSAARRLGVRILDGGGAVASSTREAVPVRLGIADKVEFAGLELSHVVFLVLDDAQLKLPAAGGYQVEAILGFPVLRSLQRIRFTSDGRLAADRSATAGPGKSGELRLIGSDLFVTARIGGIETPLQLDTGAPDSSLSTMFAAAHPQVLTGLEHRKAGTAGAGGAVIEQVAVWRAVPVEIGGRTITLPSLPVTTPQTTASPPTSMGVMGWDILGAFCSFTLDFRLATFEVGEPKGPGGCQTSTAEGG